MTPKHAESILAHIADDIEVFALFVDPSAEQVSAALAVGRINRLQFHGSESADFCASFGKPYMKAFRVQSAEAVLASLMNYSSAQKILLDSYTQNVPGGTGKTFDWNQAAAIVRKSSQPIVLAGGLGVENIAEAIAVAKPFGVDVSSGVEASPGIKDTDKMQQFVKGVRSVRV